MARPRCSPHHGPCHRGWGPRRPGRPGPAGLASLVLPALRQARTLPTPSPPIPAFLDLPEVRYGLLVVGLFIVPRLLQRYRLPAAVVALVLGAIAGIRFDLFHDDATVQLFSTLGIVSMFLFAGLEVDFDELREGLSVVVQHLVIQLVLLVLVSSASAYVFRLSTRVALLFALALLTPSTGFILDSLPSFGLDPSGRFWVKSKAISTEILALLVLLVVVQSTSAPRLVLSVGALTAMVAVLPTAFRLFSRIIAPYAPGAEFTFLVLLALICAYVTRTLGVYYLVGAFVVGVSAVGLRRELPALSSEKLLAGVQLFATFFIPFYFFKAGVSLERESFTRFSVTLGAVLALLLVPLRTGQVAWHRRISLGEGWRAGAQVGLALVPTLVFTLVIGELLRDRFALPMELYGGLIVFTIVNTLIPGVVLRTPPLPFEAPTMPGPGNAAEESDSGATGTVHSRGELS